MVGVAIKGTQSDGSFPAKAMLFVCYHSDLEVRNDKTARQLTLC